MYNIHFIYTLYPPLQVLLPHGTFIQVSEAVGTLNAFIRPSVFDRDSTRGKGKSLLNSSFVQYSYCSLIVITHDILMGNI